MAHLVTIFTCICFGLTASAQSKASAQADVPQSRLIAGKLISQKQYEKAERVLKTLIDRADPPSMHLYAMLILTGKLNRPDREALSLLCKARDRGYSKSAKALKLKNANCSSERNTRKRGDNGSKSAPLPAAVHIQWNEVQPDQSNRIVIGSGVAIADNGKFLTNEHVVDGCAQPIVAYQGLLGKAKVKAVNKKLDVALLSVDAATPQYAPLNLKPYELGETLYAAGYPLGELMGKDLKLSRGMLMSDRDDKRGFIEKGRLITDIPIGNGNSGGPLYATDGSLRGIVDAFWALSEDIPDNMPRMSGNLSSGVSSIEIARFLDKAGMRGYKTVPKSTVPEELKSTQIAKLAQNTAIRIECSTDD